MSENSIVPSMDKILKAVNSDLDKPSKSVDHINKKTTYDTDYDNLDSKIFNAKTWYLQKYPVVHKQNNESKNQSSTNVSYVKNNENNDKYIDSEKEKGRLTKTIAILIIIAIVVALLFFIYFTAENSNISNDPSQYDYDSILITGQSETEIYSESQNIVYCYTADESGTHSVTVLSNEVDPDCIIYDSNFNILYESANSGNEFITYYFEAGSTYYVSVYNSSYESGNITVCLN